MLGFSTPEIDSKAVSAELHRRAEIVREEIADHARIREDLKSLESDTLDQVYRLAVTDVFVEKAIHLLNNQANTYKWIGYIAFLIALSIIALGTCFAGKQANIGGGKSPINRKTNKKRGRK